MQRLILALMAVVFLILSGSVIGETTIMVNLQSFFLVLGGTLLTLLMAFSLKSIKELFKNMHGSITSNEIDDDQLVQEIVNLARIRRFKGLRELEERGKMLTNPILRKGIEMIVDGYRRHELQYVLERQYDIYFSRKESQAHILLTAAKLAPAFGFVGTVIGLIGVLNNLADPAQIGGGMAVALLTTFYGLLQSNFIFLPLSKKFEANTKAEETLLSILIEGLLDISENKNTHSVSYRQKAFAEINDLSAFSPRETKSNHSRPPMTSMVQRLAKGK